MLFVDGENLLARGKTVAASAQVQLQPGDFCVDGAYLWLNGFCTRLVSSAILGGHFGPKLEEDAIRAFYYSSFTGHLNNVKTYRESLHAIGFHAELFHKQKNKRAKRVDITLARDMLFNSLRDNLDVAVIFSGDEDYVPLIEEVKRAGKNVWLCWLESPEGGLSEALRLASDAFFPIDHEFLHSWRPR